MYSHVCLSEICSYMSKNQTSQLQDKKDTCLFIFYTDSGINPLCHCFFSITTALISVGTLLTPDDAVQSAEHATISAHSRLNSSSQWIVRRVHRVASRFRSNMHFYKGTAQSVACNKLDSRWTRLCTPQCCLAVSDNSVTIDKTKSDIRSFKIDKLTQQQIDMNVTCAIGNQSASFRLGEIGKLTTNALENAPIICLLLAQILRMWHLLYQSHCVQDQGSSAVWKRSVTRMWMRSVCNLLEVVFQMKMTVMDTNV